MTKVESAVEWMINLAEDDLHGYSQANRWGQDYDCSSAVIEAYQQAGVPVKSYGATYTGNMREAFLKAGFEDVTASVNLNTGAGLISGDVPLNYISHTCMYIGNGKVVNARGNDGHPEAGDQTGNEIRIQPYWNFPWNCILRYTVDSGKAGLVVDGEVGEQTWAAIKNRMPNFNKLPLIKKGSKGSAVRFLQSMLNYFGASLIVDGDFGELTEKDVMEFQEGKL